MPFKGTYVIIQQHSNPRWYPHSFPR